MTWSSINYLFTNKPDIRLCLIFFHIFYINYNDFLLFQQNNVSHPIIVLQDITTSSLQALVSYIYNGEVIVPESELADFLKSAELLKIKGLVIDESSRPSTKNSQKTKSQKENKKPKKSNNVNYEHYDENAEDDSFFEKVK